MSLGIGPLARSALGVDGGVDRCSTAYKVGEYSSLALGAGRLLYAGAAKSLPFLIRSGETELARALEISAARNTLKEIARAGTFPNARMPSAAQILEKYGDDAQAIIDAATRTNATANAVGANAAVGGAIDSTSCECNSQ